MSSVTKSRAPGWNFLRAGRGRLRAILGLSQVWRPNMPYFDSTDGLGVILKNVESLWIYIYIFFFSIYTFPCNNPNIYIYIYTYIRFSMSTIWRRSHKAYPWMPPVRLELHDICVCVCACVCASFQYYKALYSTDWDSCPNCMRTRHDDKHGLAMRHSIWMEWDTWETILRIWVGLTMGYAPDIFEDLFCLHVKIYIYI